MAEPSGDSKKTYAPFGFTNSVSLNAFQEAGVDEPYRCGNDPAHILVADVDGGWRCPKWFCTYTQDWAWVAHLDWNWSTYGRSTS
jgi:hypothetical protein